MKQKTSIGSSYLRVILAFALISSWTPAALAIPDSPWSIFLAGAYPLALGPTYTWTNGEYGITGGFGYQQADWPVGLQFEGMTYRFGFSDRAASSSGSDGYMQMTAGTANVTWTPDKFKQKGLKPRLISGIGVYNRVIKKTEEHLMTGTCWDPWWGYYPCAGTGTVVTDSQSQTKLGLNAGISIGYELASGGEFFVETRYHHAFTTNQITQFMPFNFGFRW
jgi:hypothetical protein